MSRVAATTTLKKPPAGVRIVGTGLAVPARVVTNRDLEKKIDTTDEWIVQRTGIRQRHLAGPGERCSDLATSAVRSALSAAGLTAHDLDLVIVATLTPDTIAPTAS